MKKRKVIIVCFAILIMGCSLFAQDLFAQSLNETESIVTENIEALVELEGVTITCGSREKKGPCWRRGNELKFCREYTYIQCIVTGLTTDDCTQPC